MSGSVLRIKTDSEIQPHDNGEAAAPSQKKADCMEALMSDQMGKGRKIFKISTRLVAGLTCIQFFFALYATFLLYFMSPTVTLVTEPDDSWASHFAKQWKNFMSNTQREEVGLSFLNETLVCKREDIPFHQKKNNDEQMLALKKELFAEILEFQQQTRGCETLKELLALPSLWNDTRRSPKITVILNHYKRKTLCAQLEAMLEQTLPFQNLWVLAFGSINDQNFRQIIKGFNDSRISFVSSTYDYKYYGRFQLALQAEGADYIYMIDDDMIPGKRILEILAHAAGTEKYRNAVLGSIGRILPFQQKDNSFPSYRKSRSKEAGLYLPDPAYDIVVERMMQVDFLSSSWFLSTDHVKTMFTETPFTFSTGEDLHLSYQLQKYRDAGTFVLPIETLDKTTWGDMDHRLAYISETTVIHKDVVQARDSQWWRAFVRGYVTQWARMHPQHIDVLFYAHSVRAVGDLAPLVERFRVSPGKKSLLVVSGGTYCRCEEAAAKLGWEVAACYDRKLSILDLEVGATSRSTESLGAILFHEIYASMKGLMMIHSPALLVSVKGDLSGRVREALVMAAADRQGNITLVELPRETIRHALWIADLKTKALGCWNKMTISVNVITQNRAASLRRLLRSLASAHYLGDQIALSFNMDAKVDVETIRLVTNFTWPHGPKNVRRRIIQGGLIRAVSESWFPSSENDFGLLLEDDIEVSSFFYLWLKYALLAYHYDPQSSLPELNAIALYTPRLIEVVRERPRWNATDFFMPIHPNTPYLHQLPCSWGSLFFPKHWREFFNYMSERFTDDAKSNPVRIPRSRTNGWQASWKKFLIDMMYLRGYVTLYPNFPNQTSFSTNHMEPGAHINASNNIVDHRKEDFEVPLLQEDFHLMLPDQRLPAAAKLPVLNLFNQPTTLRGLKSAGAILGQDVIVCNRNQTVTVDHLTGVPLQCTIFR